ncbi:MAG: formiminotetrahydrofolate cyclodeaminase [Pseudohongiellaceae bacterium]|jgi:formiminotetrahydrofolate cyclodeaminase
MLIESTLIEFCEMAAGRTATPGGGSIAACLGALGAAMGQMAAKFTTGRKGFEEAQGDLRAEIMELEVLRRQGLALIEEDAGAFDGVSSAYSLPKSTDVEKSKRKAAIQEALYAAMQPPLETCRMAVAGLEILEKLRLHTNPNLISDVAVGAYALAASFRSGWINVAINLSALRDARLVDEVRSEGSDLAARCESLESSISEAVLEAVGG